MSGFPFGLFIILFRFVQSDFLSFINHRNNFRKPKTSSCEVKYLKQSCLSLEKIQTNICWEPLAEPTAAWWARQGWAPLQPASGAIHLAHSLQTSSQEWGHPEPRWAGGLQNKICLGADVKRIEANNHNGNRKRELGQPNCTVVEKAKLSHVV